MPMPQGKYFRIGYGIIIGLLIILLANQVGFIFRPIVIVVRTLLLPFILSAVFYYLLRPLLAVLEARKIKKSIAILIIYLLLFGLAALLIIEVGPMIQNQVSNLIDNIPQIVDAAKTQVNKLQQNQWVANYFAQHQDEISAKVSGYVNGIISNTGQAFNTLLGFISSIVVLLSTVPFILYYLLKDGAKIREFIINLVPDQHDNKALQIMEEMDGALSAYIQGKILVSLCLGMLIFIGYQIIGVQYALLLALAATLMNVIPFVGLFIGMIPSVVVAFIDSPSMLIKVIIVALIAQQIEANFLSPQIMGKKLDMHPLTIILLLIGVGSLSGLLGMFIAIPTYAVLKVIVSHLYRIYLLRRRIK
jgi:predicted PurR-regulated permease PerM